MANSYFQFKQFNIQQDKCAMKVCTDACILGAFAAEQFATKKIHSILDVGCGTGLLGLMLAQKLNAAIDAIEIEPNAAGQAKENADSSPWSGRVKVIERSLLEFKPLHNYDLIVCNPPFFEGDLHSPDKNINAARHDTSLTLTNLFAFVKGSLAPEGNFVVLLPFQRMQYAEAILREQSLFVKEKLLLRQTPAHIHFRCILLVTKCEHQHVIQQELVIHDSNRNYTAAFQDLLKDYYLKF